MQQLIVQQTQTYYASMDGNDLVKCASNRQRRVCLISMRHVFILYRPTPREDDV